MPSVNPFSHHPTPTNRDVVGTTPAGTITFYTRDTCAGLSYGCSAANFDCLTGFGFVAKAVGLEGQSQIGRTIPERCE